MISNCARLELLLVAGDNDEDPREAVSRELLYQVQFHQKHPHSMQLALGWDVPNCIDSSSSSERPTKATTTTNSNNVLQNLVHHWTHVTDPSDIIHHVCLVAAGLAPRPRRPNRPVPFQPFSSRDAHVLLQLKRTLDTCYGKQTSLVLQGALQAGKAVRNAKIVPELSRLRQYGTGDSKYNMAPPQHVLDTVTQAAMTKGLAPVVHATIERLRLAQDEQLTQSIANFRTQAQALARNDEERAWIRKQLHEPTVRLRDSPTIVCVETILNDLQVELLKRRRDMETGNA